MNKIIYHDKRQLLESFLYNHAFESIYWKKFNKKNNVQKYHWSGVTVMIFDQVSVEL